MMTVSSRTGQPLTIWAAMGSGDVENQPEAAVDAGFDERLKRLFRKSHSSSETVRNVTSSAGLSAINYVR